MKQEKNISLKELRMMVRYERYLKRCKEKNIKPLVNYSDFKNCKRELIEENRTLFMYAFNFFLFIIVSYALSTVFVCCIFNIPGILFAIASLPFYAWLELLLFYTIFKIKNKGGSN